jgi:DsbC/DsbD-like thiol-disulfide interchange protein
LAGLVLGAACAVAAGFLGAPRDAVAAASPWAINPQSQVRLVSAYRVAPRGGPLRLGLQFRLAPRWHVYWKNSGDAGYAPVVAFARQPGLSYPQMLWPAPHRFALAGGLEAFGYADEVVYPVQATLAAAAGQGGGGSLRLTADVDYLTCEVDCVPHRYTLTLDQPVGDKAVADPATAPLLDRWFGQVPVALKQQAAVHADLSLRPAAAGSGPRPAAELELTLRLRGAGAAVKGADVFFESQSTFELGRPQMRVEPGGIVFLVPVRRTDSSAPLPAKATFAWTATGLTNDDGKALALEDRQEVTVGAAAPAFAAPPTIQPPASRPAGLRAALAAADPRVMGAFAIGAALLALYLFDLLRAGAQYRRQPWGFLALLLAVFFLYALSLEVGAETLAAVELSVLAFSLLAWLYSRKRAISPH